MISFDDLVSKVEAWRIDYNTVRPHSALEGMSPEYHYRRFLKQSELPLAPVDSGGASDGNCEAHSQCPQDLAVG
jgi:hypothetical protein